MRLISLSGPVLESGGDAKSKRRSCLPAPCPNASNISLWNILRNNIGKDLSKVAMPVELNEPLNTLQRLCEELEYSELLDKAAQVPSALERMVRSHSCGWAVWPLHPLFAGGKEGGSRAKTGRARAPGFSSFRLDYPFSGFISHQHLVPLCLVVFSHLDRVCHLGELLSDSWCLWVVLLCDFTLPFSPEPSEWSFWHAWLENTVFRGCLHVYFYYPGWTEFNFPSCFSCLG